MGNCSCDLRTEEVVAMGNDHFATVIFGLEDDA